MCLAMPAIQAQGEGFEVYVVTDASGGVSPEAHDMCGAQNGSGWHCAYHLDGSLRRVAA
jgi:nicotinamidase-related amidase